MSSRSGSRLFVCCLAIGAIGCRPGDGGSDGSDTQGIGGDGDGDGDGVGDGDGDGDGAGDGDGDGDGQGPKWDVLGGGDAGGGGGPTDATLTGTVFAPNGIIPISGALVYTTTGEVEGIPDHAYCEECVDLPPTIHWTYSNPDGTFELPAYSGDDVNFVVQKGQFLRVTSLDIPAGDSDAPALAATLPNQWLPDDGQWIPKMVIMQTWNDGIENLLAKTGVGQADAQGLLVPGSAPFDVMQGAQGSALLDDLDAMLDYHIIFIPCMSQGGLGYPSGQRLDNIRAFVEAGGKWYVTDWANEYLYEPFPDYQTFYGWPADPDLSYYDSTGTILDPDLLAWLGALPEQLKDPGGGLPTLYDLPQVGLVDNWSAIESIPAVIVQNEQNEDVNVGHYAWVEGPGGGGAPVNPAHPMTITAQYGCGKMLFSTYHTAEGNHPGLMAQELILFYLILEIGVCQDPLPPPG